jgi:hypothetical protein
MLRKSLVVLSMIAGLGAFAQGCGNDCDAAADDVAAKNEECGITATDGEDGSDETVECTDEVAAAATCFAACYTAAPCEAFDGSDPDALADYAACTADC